MLPLLNGFARLLGGLLGRRSRLCPVPDLKVLAANCRRTSNDWTNLLPAHGGAAVVVGSSWVISPAGPDSSASRDR
jgi:hypothetical protein